jgi:radical SAM superfamily enzyme YgiQ (UPF0313 family)
VTDLLLVHPGSAKIVYQTLESEFTAIEPPLWCRLIAGYCMDRGHSVKILDAEADDLSPKRVAERVAEISPKLTCIVAYGHQPSASTQSMEAVIEISREIKKALRDCFIIIVGGHAAALPELTLEDTGANYVCTGEGPATVETLLRAPPSEVPGLMWRGGKTKPAPLVDVDELHGDVWNLLPMERYRAHNWQCLGDMKQKQPYASIYTSLGCPFKCSFCCINAPFGGNFYRMRKPEDVIYEIDRLYHEYGVKTFKIIDEMFVLNGRHVKAVCEGLTAKPYAKELNIWAYARVDTVKPGQPEMLRKAGIRWLALGIESGSSHVRDGAEKSFNQDDIFSTVRMIQDAGINVIGNYIFGLPDDTMETMQETFDLAEELNCEFANFYSAMAYPGSKLYEDKTLSPFNKNKLWSAYSQHSFHCSPTPTRTLSSAQVLKFRDDAFYNYFTGMSYLNMVASKFGPETCYHIAKMAQIRLDRALLKPTFAKEEVDGDRV